MKHERQCIHVYQYTCMWYRPTLDNSNVINYTRPGMGRRDLGPSLKFEKQKETTEHLRHNTHIFIMKWNIIIYF